MSVPHSIERVAAEDLRSALRLQDRLTRVSRLAILGEMAAGVAHELNQPLAAIANYAQACDRLLAAPGTDVNEVREALRQITGQAVRAGEIIRRLRSLARPQDSPEALDVNTLLRELRDLIECDARAHEVALRWDLAAQLPAVRADRAQIQQVVLNLVRNAVEAIEQAGAQTRCLTVRTRHPPGEVEIEVADSGPGVHPDVRASLFHPFCTTKAAGTGLGLAISASIARAHRGTLAYHPNDPQGACFVLRLPAATTDTAAQRPV